MIDVSKVAYNVYAVLQDGTRLNVTPAVTDLGWEEGEGELSARFSFTAANVDYNGNPLSSTIKPNTAIVVTASAGGDEKEVANGKVIEWYPQDSATAKGFSVVCYDDLYNLQKSQDDRYIKAGTGTKSALNAIFSDWGIPAGEYKGPDKPHAKTLFKAEYLGDIITELLDDAEKHGADYLGVGAVFPTGSKDDADDVSYDTLKAICQAVSIPVVAIGGITQQNVEKLAGSGICGVAVISAIYAAKNIGQASKDLKAATEKMLHD